MNKYKEMVQDLETHETAVREIAYEYEKAKQEVVQQLVKDNAYEFLTINLSRLKRHVRMS